MLSAVNEDAADGRHLRTVRVIERYDLPETYGAICFVILASIVFFDVTERLERWLRPSE